MTESIRIATSLNTKTLDGDYVRYDIGASSKNVFYYYNDKYYSVKNIITNIKSGCLNPDTLKFSLQHPLTIVGASGNSAIYDGTVSRTIDLSKFLTKSAKWNDLAVDTSQSQYISYYWDSDDEIQEISYNAAKGGWITSSRKPQSLSKAYWYPRYSGAISYRPTSVGKITLPKGVYLINYAIKVSNLYDSNFDNSTFTGNTGIYESGKVFFAQDGIERVTPGMVSATLCPDEDFKKIQNHDYKEYPSDMFAITDGYYSPGIARTATRTQGTLINSAYTSHSMVYKVTTDQIVLHLLVTHQNEPTDNLTKGYSVDSNGKKRILCPVSGWIQIMALSSMD